MSDIPNERSTTDAVPAADDDYEQRAYPWVSLVASAGAGIIGLVGVQVAVALVQGIVLRPGEWGGVADDLAHRLGFPFGGLGATAGFLLVLALVLLALPDLLDVPLTRGQDRISGAAATGAIALAVILMIGAVLAARGSIQQYAARVEGGIPVAALVQFVNALLGSLGAAALALFTAVGLRRLRATATADADLSGPGEASEPPVE